MHVIIRKVSRFRHDSKPLGGIVTAAEGDLVNSSNCQFMWKHIQYSCSEGCMCNIQKTKTVAVILLLQALVCYFFMDRCLSHSDQFCYPGERTVTSITQTLCSTLNSTLNSPFNGHL